MLRFSFVAIQCKEKLFNLVFLEEGYTNFNCINNNYYIENKYMPYYASIDTLLETKHLYNKGYIHHML